MVLRSLVLGAAIALSLVAPATAQKKFNDVTITIATFGGPWIDRIKLELAAPLAAEGITMNFVAGSSAEFLAKLIAARGQPAPFDVVEIADETYGDFRAGDFLEKMNAANLPNLKFLDKSMYDEFKVANWASQPGIVYNVEKFAAAGIAPPTKYSDLANPALKGKVLLSDISGYAAYYQITGLAFENGGSDKNPDAGFAMMKKINAHSYSTSVATTLQLFNGGDVWAGIVPVHLGIRMFDAGLPLSAVHPTINGHKGAIARGYLGVSKGSKQLAAAEYYINAMIDTGMQERLYTQAATIPVNRVTMEKVRGTVKVDKAGQPFLLMDPAIVAQMWSPDYAVIDKRDWARRWQRSIAN